MAFKKILFVPTTDNLELSGGQALLALAGPGTAVDVFEPVYSTDLQDYSAVSHETYERARDELVKKRLSRVEGLVDELESRGIEATVTAAWDHPVHEAIIRRVLTTKADLVITEPIEGRAGALSNADWRLASRCPVPLLLVRREDTGTYAKIVAAVDPFHEHDKPAELDESIIHAAKEVQAMTRGELQVVHCFAPLTEVMPRDCGEYLPLDFAEETLEASRAEVLGDLVEKAGLQTGSAKLLRGTPNAALESLVEGGGVDLLVMGSLSRGRFRDFVLGNTAEHVLYHTDVDILLVKPPGFETTVAEQASEDLLIRPLYFPF